MIKSRMGTVTIDGTESEILAETMGILDAVFQMLKETYGEKHALRRVESLGSLYVRRKMEVNNIRRIIN